MSIHLNNQQLTQFLDRGYLIINLNSVPKKTHDELFQEAKTLYSTHSQEKDKRAALNLIADNLTARSRFLQEIVEAPEIDGALNDILGDGYYRYSHSFIHQSNESNQTFHKDSTYPWGLRAGLRSHRPNWAMVFYYPQETTLELGPTYVVPGSQYWNVNHEIDDNTYGEDRLIPTDQDDKNSESYDLALANSTKTLDKTLRPFPILVPQGSVVIVHFDLFHRGSRRQSRQHRFMYKFWYVRTMEPRARTFTLGKTTDSRRFAVVAKVAQWLTGERRPLSPGSDRKESNEAFRLDRALRIGQDNQLLNELTSVDEEVRRAAMYGLSNTGNYVTDTAIAALLHEHWGVRKAAAFVLGETAIFSHKVIEELAHCAGDSCEKNETRSTAITSIGRIGRKALAESRFETMNVLLDGIEPATLAPLESNSERSVIPMSRIQQSAALALLMIATESIAAGAQSVALCRLSELAAGMARPEFDRYAQATAIECCRRLAPFGLDTSIEILREQTKNPQSSKHFV